jgi:hypothetical protein
MTSHKIEEMQIPRSLAKDHEGMFAGMMAVRNAVEIAAYDIPEVTARRPAEARPRAARARSTASGSARASDPAPRRARSPSATELA